MADWATKEWVIFSLPLGLLLLGVIVWFFMRKTLRTRVRVGLQLRDDPDINEWLIVFGWSRKVLYVPTIVASLGAFVAMLFVESNTPAARAVGGIWLAIFFLNFLIDEYELSIKVLLILVLCIVALGLWLLFLGWLMSFIRFFENLGISIDAMGYLLIAAIFVMAILISWIRGLFYYVAITPNYMNIQVGPTETGEQISREEFSTRVDTGDFLERLLGFGRIIITFSDQRRQPMMLLVGRIGRRAQKLESVRGKLAFDRYQPAREGKSEAF